MTNSIADIRRDYMLESLLEKDAAKDPVQQFERWWEEAVNSKIDEVNAMTLATATKLGIPSARIVLLKAYEKDGFVFFTNYNSQKGKDIEANPFVSLLFFWKELERQIRIDGRIEKISEADSEAYFNSRPEGSKIGAWSSPQSSVIADRSVIENNFLQNEEKFRDKEIPRPSHWGGYIVKPVSFEFWQGRSSRLHDRLKYTQNAGAGWTIERLAP